MKQISFILAILIFTSKNVNHGLEQILEKHYDLVGKWLENFAYKTELSWWIFALAGVLALGIALLTVSWQSWKAATRNPVEALRYE